jgi:hypothetical protein
LYILGSTWSKNILVNLLWNNDIFKAYFRFILILFSKYSQNELLTPYLYLNKLLFYFISINCILYSFHIVCNKVKVASLEPSESGHPKNLKRIFMGSLKKVRIYAQPCLGVNTLKLFYGPLTKLTFYSTLWRWDAKWKWWGATQNYINNCKIQRRPLFVTLLKNGSKSLSLSFPLKWKDVWMKQRTEKDSKFIWSMWHRAFY